MRAQTPKPPEYKTPQEVGRMREAGKLVAGALAICRALAKPGVKTIDIDRAVDSYYASHGAVPLFKGYPGKVPFPASTCLSVNEQVVHGIPGSRVLKDGDLLKIDTACRLDGWCADSAVTLPIGTVRPEWLRLLRVATEILNIAIDLTPRKKWWSEVASAMQSHAERNKFASVTQYVGHGIGRAMHESPQVPNYVSRDTRKHDFKLVPGLVLAVEPMLVMGRPDVQVLRDHWTVVTKDGLPTVHVEHTIALMPDGSLTIVTADDPDAVAQALSTIAGHPAAAPAAEAREMAAGSGRVAAAV